MGKVAVDIEALKWAVEALANDAIATRDAGQALMAIRLYDSLKAARHESVVGCVLPDLARLAHVDL